MNRKKLSCIALLLLMFFTVSIVAESASVAAETGLIGRWKFDENTGLVGDHSVWGKHGIITGTTWVKGFLNKALKFSGSADYVKVPASVEGLSNWSLKASIKPTGTGEMTVYSEKDSRNNPYFYIKITADNRIKVGAYCLSRVGEWDIYQTDHSKIKRNEWNQLLVTLEHGGVEAKSGTVKCYVNGDLVGQGDLGYALKMPKGVVGAYWMVGPETTLTRLGDGVGKSPGADFDNVYPWSEMEQLIQDEQTVVKIPKFYYRRTYDGERHGFWIADKPTTGFKLHPAFIRKGVEKPYILVGANKFGAGATRASCRSTAKTYGTGWGLIDIQTWSAIQMLWLVEYADTDSDKFSSNYRGINGLCTRPGPWIDGINVQDSRVYISENNAGFADDVFSGDYKDTSFVLPGSVWITNWHCSPAYDWLFLPSAGGGSRDTYIPDYIWTNSGNRVACAGFGLNGAGYGGLFYWCVNFSSGDTLSGLGGRALHIP